SPEQCAVSAHRPPAAPPAVCTRRCSCRKARETPAHAEPLSFPPGGHGAPVGCPTVAPASRGLPAHYGQSPKAEGEDAGRLSGVAGGGSRAAAGLQYVGRRPLG